MTSFCCHGVYEDKLAGPLEDPKWCRYRVLGDVTMAVAKYRRVDSELAWASFSPARTSQGMRPSVSIPIGSFADECLPDEAAALDHRPSRSIDRLGCQSGRREICGARWSAIRPSSASTSSHWHLITFKFVDATALHSDGLTTQKTT